MPALAEFQREFADALHPGAMPEMRGNAYGLGFAVYRNTVSKGLVEVLRANYPTVEQLVGGEWFDSIALLYASEHLPTQPALALYGERFSDFIAAPADTHGLHYLSSVATLDRLWTEVYFAADAAVLTAATLQTIAPTQLPMLDLQRHAAMRVAWLPHSAVTIWQHNRPPATPSEEFSVADVAEGMLLTRPHGEVIATTITRAEYDFLQHLHDGLSLGEAALQVMQQHAETDVAAMLARLIQVGAFAELDRALQD